VLDLHAADELTEDLVHVLAGADGDRVAKPSQGSADRVDAQRRTLQQLGGGARHRPELP